MAKKWKSPRERRALLNLQLIRTNCLMKMPPSNSRGYKILCKLAIYTLTVRQGIEKHGDMGLSMGKMRSLYDDLVLIGAATCEGLVYRITNDALAHLQGPKKPKTEPVGVPAGPQYRGDWRTAPALNPASARRLGYSIAPGGER